MVNFMMTIKMAMMVKMVIGKKMMMMLMLITIVAVPSSFTFKAEKMREIKGT